MKISFFLVLLACLYQPAAVMAQADSISGLTPKQEKKRLAIVSATGLTLYAGSMTALYQLWYKNYPQSSFHFINDNHEWMQMDKAGHTFTAYYEGIYGYQLLKWAGVSHKKAALYGGSWGFLLQTPIEILDGFSSGWGFSWGDMAANTSGALLSMLQQYYWDEQRIQLKFSYSPSPYPAMFPNGKGGPLGETFQERLIKDYNGQTYWLSAGLHDFVPGLHMPRWLNIAVGYGADGMLRGTYADQSGDASIPVINRQRQLYLSLDLNLQKIPTKSRILGTIFQAVSFIKVPAPAIEYATTDGFKFHIIYF